MEMPETPAFDTAQVEDRIQRMPAEDILEVALVEIQAVTCHPALDLRLMAEIHRHHLITFTRQTANHLLGQRPGGARDEDGPFLFRSGSHQRASFRWEKPFSIKLPTTALTSSTRAATSSSLRNSLPKCIGGPKLRYMRAGRGSNGPMGK